MGFSRWLEDFHFKKFLKTYRTVLVILAVVLYYFFLRDKSPLTTIKLWDLYVGIAVAGYMAFMGFIDTLKYNSHQVSMPVLHFSLGEHPASFHEDGIDFFMFRLGGYNHNMMAFAGDDGVLVVPKCFTFNQAGEFVLTALPIEVDFDELPDFARRHIKYLNLPSPYFMCLVPAKEADIDHVVQHTNPENIKASYQALILAKNRLVAEQQDVIKNKYDSFDELSQKTSNMAQSFNKAPSSGIHLPLGNS